jgi:hypothetical protein
MRLLLYGCAQQDRIFINQNTHFASPVPIDAKLKVLLDANR